LSSSESRKHNKQKQNELNVSAKNESTIGRILKRDDRKLKIEKEINHKCYKLHRIQPPENVFISSAMMIKNYQTMEKKKLITLEQTFLSLLKNTKAGDCFSGSPEILLDFEEKYKQQKRTFSGSPEILSHFEEKYKQQKRTKSVTPQRSVFSKNKIIK
jgi:hypothetical protein